MRAQTMVMTAAPYRRRRPRKAIVAATLVLCSGAAMAASPWTSYSARSRARLPHSNDVSKDSRGSSNGGNGISHPSAVHLGGSFLRDSVQRPTASSSWDVPAAQRALRVQGGAGARVKGGAGNKHKATSRESLYEAYNLLHSLGKEFKLNIEAPAVLVVGHQTAGKSALIEALMGFQFNNVGGGTKTRRPIALHMKYNAACSQPVCYLTNDAGLEERMSLDEIQEYITKENARLEADPTRCFDHREICIRVEYRYCPNMVMVDTPGLINTGVNGGNGGRISMNAHERAHAQAAKEAENLVLNKMKCPEYIILCVEDTTDWKHATTRALVEQADPHLSRTVIVNTKLDTKLLQFADAADVQDFIAAPIVRKLHPHLSGGPFFTSIPAGRVGRLSTHEFRSNEMFLNQLRRRERDDLAIVSSKLGESRAQALSNQLGVRKLRRFLERRVEKCYRTNVATIVPVLQGALKKTEDALERTAKDLDALSMDSLKQTANQYREHFSRALADCVQGTICASPEVFGETLETEQLGGGSFFTPGFSSAALSGEAWQNLVHKEVGNVDNKLYGGSQYHRALREFALAVQNMALPEVTADEIANAAGVNDVHDGTNYMRAACVIAVSKAQESFEPLLEALQIRTRHVMRRLFPIVKHILDQKGVALDNGVTEETTRQYAAFTDALSDIYNEFVESALSECLSRCEDDLRGMTRFVTWDLQERGSLAVQASLPSKELVGVYALTMEKQRRRITGDGEANMPPPEPSRKRGSKKQKNAKNSKNGGNDVLDEWYSANAYSQDSYDGYGDMSRSGSEVMQHGRHEVDASMDERSLARQRDQIDLLTLMEQVSCMRDGNRTHKVVSTLVQHIVRAWRMSFAQSVAMKFNCFFLLPFLDEFPFYLRSQLDKMYEGDLNHLFDISEARSHIEKKLMDLEGEYKANLHLQSKFESVNRQLGRSEEALSDCENIIGGDAAEFSVDAQLAQGFSSPAAPADEVVAPASSAANAPLSPPPPSSAVSADMMGVHDEDVDDDDRDMIEEYYDDSFDLTAAMGEDFDFDDNGIDFEEGRDEEGQSSPWWRRVGGKDNIGNDESVDEEDDFSVNPLWIDNDESVDFDQRL